MYVPVFAAIDAGRHELAAGELQGVSETAAARFVCGSFLVEHQPVGLEVELKAVRFLGSQHGLQPKRWS